MINDSCTTLPVSLYTINASVTFMNGSRTNYVSINIMDTSGDSMGRFNVSYNKSFDEELVPNAAYIFTVNSANTQQPQTSPTLTLSKYLLCLYSTQTTHVCICICIYCMADIIDKVLILTNNNKPLYLTLLCISSNYRH